MRTGSKKNIEETTKVHRNQSEDQYENSKANLSLKMRQQVAQQQYAVKDKLKNRLFETGHFVKMPSMSSKDRRENTIIPSRVLQGREFYQNRVNEMAASYVLMTSVASNQPLNLNKVSNLIDASFHKNSRVLEKLPPILENRSKSMNKTKRLEKIIPVNVIPADLSMNDSFQTGDPNMSQLNNISVIQKKRAETASMVQRSHDKTLERTPGQLTNPNINSSSNQMYTSFTAAFGHNVIDKLTGRNIPPSRLYKNPSRVIRSSSLRGGKKITEDSYMALPLDINEEETSSVNKSVRGDSRILIEDDLMENSGTVIGDDVVMKLKDIDSFIYLMKEGRLNSSEFIYLVKGPSSDPYNLITVEFNDIKEKQYFTLSEKGVCKFENNMPIEFVTLKEWLRERDQYNAIKQLSFFKKFRRWKTLKKWVKILRRNKKSVVATRLMEKLFIANPVLQSLIVKHKDYCLKVEMLRFVDTATNLDIQTLEIFTSTQQRKKQTVVQELQDLSRELHENSRAGIRQLLEKLRDHIVSEMSNEDEQKRTEEQDLKDLNGNVNKGSGKNVFESLGFPEFLNYGHRSLLRNECSRFLRLAYLLDFMTMEALGNMYIYSAKDLLNRMTDLFDLYDSGLCLGPHQKKQLQEPLFAISCVFDPTDIDNEYIEKEQIEVPLKNIENFDLNEFSDFEIDAKQEEEEDDQKKKGKKALKKVEESLPTEEEEKPKFKRVIPKISLLWLSVTPRLQEFYQTIDNFFLEACDSMMVIERWSKHSEFLPYANALEEWDEIIGEKWIMPDSKFLNAMPFLNQNHIYKTFKSHFSKLILSSQDRILSLLNQYTPLLNFFWRESATDYKILQNKKLLNKSKIFQTCMDFYNSVSKIYEEKLIQYVDIGLFRLDLTSIRKALLPMPQKCLKYLETLLPALLHKRIFECRAWLDDSIRKMNGMVLGIEEFIDQKNNLNKIISQFGEIKKVIDSNQELYMLLVENTIPITHEDKEKYNEMLLTVNMLNNVIQNAELNAAKNQDKFIKTLNDKILRMKNEAQELFMDIKHEKFLFPSDKINETITELQELEQKVIQIEGTAEKYKGYEEVLQVQEFTDFSLIDDLRNEMNLRLVLWKSKQEWNQLTQEYLNLPFNQINPKEISQKADSYAKQVYRCEKNMPESKVIQDLKKQVCDFRDTMPIVTALRSPFLKEGHWQEIKTIIQTDFSVEDDEFKLKNLMDLDVVKFQEELVAIATQATQENSLDGQIIAIENIWKNKDLTFKSYKEKKDVYILCDLEDVFSTLDESLASMNNILASRYVKPLRVRAEKLQGDLLLLNDILDKWAECQKKWMYLETIFSAADIKKSLQEESQSFEQCDKTLRNIFKRIVIAPNAYRSIRIPNILENLTKTSENLDVIEKHLENYLEQKRRAFPRFYFLSNDDLVEILANSQNIDAVQKHLRKCFENIYKLDIQMDVKPGPIINAIISAEGEAIPFNKGQPIYIKGFVENWLDTLQKSMFDYIQRLIKEGLDDLLNNVDKDRNSWILHHYGQVVAVASQINWCLSTEDAINDLGNRPTALQEFYELNISQLSQLTDLVRSNITSLQRRIVVALITVDVHSRDIIEKLCTENVESTSNFLWQQQLRYYYDWQAVQNGQIGSCYILQVSARLNYGYEYLGATSRLVITPLTDRCWITITGALNIQLGAAPAGPAGTGKTESTKDLAKSLGIFCVVFNCSDQVTCAMMAKLFSGLVQQGAWTCLDEFNRIDVEVLSVIAQQLLTVRLALISKEPEFLFDGQMIHLKTTFGCFITMNPGYAGRTELPDNLKVLFRPVSMMIPDYGLIAEIMLFAEGFQGAKSLSKKMVQLYKLSSEQLSQQDHYDFGMRAVKSVLVMAGSLKRAESHLSEDVVLIRAMRDSNVPKFLKDDLPLFQALIQDLFPGVNIPSVNYGELTTQIQESIKVLKLQKIEAFELKVVQLFETFNVRFGVMLVGPTGSGKSKCYKVLQHAMTSLHEKGSKDQRFQVVQTHILNPKSISMGELYGEINPYTQEWVDGLGSSKIRNANLEHENPAQRDWVVFDGPVDALWIENMNTVLDDNMTLCLANGERIKLRPELRMLFEVQDLAAASPATVSRCGMVYLSQECTGWMPYVQSWIESKYSSYDILPDKKYKDYLLFSFLNTVDMVLNKIKATCYEPIPTVPIQMAANICNFLQALITRSVFKNPDNVEENKRKLNYIYCYSFIWGMGAAIDASCHDKFDQIVKDVFKTLVFPRTDTMFDFFLDDEYTFASWEPKIPEFSFDRDAPYFNLLVPTTDTTKYSEIMEMLILNQKPIFLTGVTGVGKTVVIQKLLFDLKERQNVNTINLTFSAQTQSYETQITIENKLNKKKQGCYGARPGEKIAIFIDDINMPLLESYGAQPSIELLRQYLDMGGFYDRTKHFWKTIEDTVLICAAAPPGGGRAVLTPRFTRWFNLICAARQSDKALIYIFKKIMDGFLHSWPFNESVRKMSENIVLGTVDVYSRISTDLLPTPAKFHYTFNLRDISKVFQGILMVKPQSCTQPDDLIRLWIHENTRVFADRLINNEDKLWFNKHIMDVLGRIFKVTWTYEAIFDKNKIIFGDLLKLEAPVKLYEEIKEKAKLIKVLESKQEENNMSSTTKLNLVFFDDAIDHIMRISRILRQPRGNAMLIGVGGSGKQSLARLSSFILNNFVLQIELTKNYSNDAFKADIMKFMVKTGVERIPVTFIFTDSQIAHEVFLEYINNILNSGEIPNLFAKKEDYDEIINQVRPYNKELKRIDSPEVIYNTFIQTVRDNLHIVLCMSPVGENLRVWCRKFPSLVNCCTLDWFSAWPKEALISVSYKLLSEINFPKDSTICEGLSNICCDMNLHIENTSNKFFAELKRKVYNTPKSYLDQINLYINILNQKRNINSSIRNKLKDGLEKLINTNKIVSDLKAQLTELQPKLEEQTVKTENFLAQLAIDSTMANEKERIVEQETEQVNIQAMEIKKVADEAQTELDKALPALKEAEDALKTINKQDLAEIRTFVNPHEAVRLVIEAVCILLGEKTDWASAKSNVLMDINFIDKLNNYDKYNVPDGILKKLRVLTAKPEFEPNYVGSKSSACKSLCLWCRAIDNFSKVNKEIEPKKKKMNEMSTKLEIKNKELALKQDELAAIRNRVAKLQKECDETMIKKEQLLKEMDLTRKRLIRAEKLTNLLADEGVRWKDQLAKLNIEYDQLIGNAFISASTISYLGPFTGPYRSQMISVWAQYLEERQIPYTPEYSLTSIAGDPIKIREWCIFGLPTDTVSIDNAIITSICPRWPLMIDPQIQANKWIKNTYKNDNLKILKFTDSSLIKTLQGCIANGFPLLIEDIEERLEPSIETVLQKAIMNIDGRKLIRVGDNTIDWNSDFKLFLTTKLPNPHYLPEVFIKVTIINFTVTFEGLQDQLLGDVVKQERPDIEQQKDEIVINVSNLKKSLKDLQDKILENLAQSKGNILDDTELIATLEDSKIKSAEVTINLENSIEIEKVINQTRSSYVPVAIRGTILYFVITDLAGIDPMYQYSLSYFKRLFNVSIENSAKVSSLEERLDTLVKNITKNVYVNVCRGLFEAHKKIFSFLICTSINRRNGSISETDWNLFLRGPPQSDISDLAAPSPDKRLISNPCWIFLQYLSTKREIFKDVAIDFSNNLSKWENFIFSEDIYNEKLDNYEYIEGFNKLLLIRAVKPENLVLSMIQYVSKQMGKFYEESATATMDDVYNDSDCKTPIIFILSQGADPSTTLIKFASMKNQKLQRISLGQGQGKKAEDLINFGKREGFWILLQNCHLAKSWMPRLEEIVEAFNTNKEDIVHNDFRLFLTSMPANYFPVSVLQNGVKLTTEPPRGLKANLKRTYQEFSQEFLDICVNKPQQWRKLLFGLSFFHAIIQERRKFGPLGFNIKYEFNDSDLEVSSLHLKMFLDTQSEEIPWDAMIYVTGHINYGGRVTDDWDRICLLSILKKYYTSELLQDDYFFSDSGTYYAPHDGKLDIYKDYIESLPINDSPEVFGMNENANITFLTQESNKILETILSIQPRLSDSNQAKSTDEIIFDIAKQLLNDLPSPLIKEQGNKKLFETNSMGLLPSLSTVLLQELDKFNNLLNVMKNSLTQLQNAIKGLVVMSQELDQMYNAFLNNQLPNNWKKVAYPSLKPLGSWYLDLLERIKFMSNWLMNDNPASYWLSGFYFPQGFMTGVLQTHARKAKIAIDKLAFKFKIIQADKEKLLFPPKDGVYIYGLYLDGARWDSHQDTLTDQYPGEIYTKMPVIHFIPVENYVTAEGDYSCPVYKTSIRVGVLSTTGQSTNFILAVDLPSKNDKPESWTLKGTALLCQLDI